MLSVGRVLLVVSAIFAACLCASPVRAQQSGTYPAFTLVSQVTDYDAKGTLIPAYTETRYFSASGDWRYLGSYPGGQTVETIFRQGLGVYFPDHRNGRLLKIGGVSAGQPARPTAEILRADPKFTRTKYVLGLTAYVHRERERVYGYVTETYFVPELGRIAFKRVTTFRNGYKRIEEPLSITFGEPEASLVRGVNYPLKEQVLLSGRDLSETIQQKPAPLYPQEAQALGISGNVDLQVIIDETGHVISARVVSLPLPLLDESAMDAAYHARFSPTELEGKPVKVSGVLTYKFTLSQARSN